MSKMLHVCFLIYYHLLADNGEASRISLVLESL